MVVGYDVSRRIDDKAGTQRCDVAGRIRFGTEKILEKVLQGRTRRQSRNGSGLRRRLQRFGCRDVDNGWKELSRKVGERIRRRPRLSRQREQKSTEESGNRDHGKPERTHVTDLEGRSRLWSNSRRRAAMKGSLVSARAPTI